MYVHKVNRFQELSVQKKIQRASYIQPITTAVELASCVAIARVTIEVS